MISIGLGWQGTSSALMRAHPCRSSLRSFGVCSQGSYPSLSPGFNTECNQSWMEISEICWGSKISRSTWLRTCNTYRPSTNTTAWFSNTTAVPADPVKPVSQANRSAQGGRYSFWYSSACGMMNPDKPCLANCERKFLTRIFDSVLMDDHQFLVVFAPIPRENSPL